MKLRRVISVLSGSEEDTPLLNSSYSLCADYGARLDSLFFRRNAASGGDLLGDAFSTYGMEAVLEALDDAAVLAARKARASYEALADDAERDHLGRFIEFIGLPRSAMSQEGRLCDLLIMPKPSRQDLRNKLNSIETAAFESGRPVLVLPLDGQASEAANQLADLSDYLELHGIKSATRSVELSGRSIARALIESSDQNGADLLVMGGFGASGWQRSLSRDETTCLIKDLPFAILLAH